MFKQTDTIKVLAFKSYQTRQQSPKQPVTPPPKNSPPRNLLASRELATKGSHLTIKHQQKNKLETKLANLAPINAAMSPSCGKVNFFKGVTPDLAMT